jgi:dTDP-4-amino-4,6-dideoxygalactose transaminase
VYRREHAPGFRWLHESFGTNWRLTEMQSALGRVQLRKLPEWVRRRRRNAEILSEKFAKLDGLRLTAPPAEVGHSFYKYYAFVRPERLKKGWDRDRIVAEITARGVPCFSGSCSEIYLEKAFSEDMRPSHRLPVAKELGETSLMYLVHPTLTELDMKWMAQVAKEVVEKATE